MDTITHGIAGALIGKALFNGDDLFTMRPVNRERLVSWSLMLGAIFPDSDTFRDMFSHNELLVITWHRSITHSLVCLPVFALLLAALTRWIARWRKWDAPSFAALMGIYAVGILSHILLDLVTSFGTMVWSPLKWSRPTWDLIFIVDFTFTGILLIPQILAWVHERPERSRRRALVSSDFLFWRSSRYKRLAMPWARRFLHNGVLIRCDSRRVVSASAAPKTAVASGGFAGRKRIEGR